MNRTIYLLGIVFGLMLISCSKKHPVETSVKVAILNPTKDSLNVYINNEFVRNVTSQIGYVYLTEDSFEFSIRKNKNEENKVTLDIDSDDSNKLSNDLQKVRLINANMKNDYVLIDCSAAYYEGIEYTIKEKFINKSIIEFDSIYYMYFRLSWEKLPKDISGYGDLSMYKLCYIPEQYIVKSDKEILKYCSSKGIF